MRIEKLSENKIRIFLNLEDLKEKNIDIQSFMSNPIESQALFLDVLALAEEKMGFVTKNYQLSIEALAMSCGDFVLTVTRKREESPKKKKHFQIKRKSEDLTQNSIIYAFQSFEDFIEFCIGYQNSPFLELKKYLNTACLYELNSTYYLVLSAPLVDMSVLKKFSTFMAEFAEFIYDSDLFARKLQEYGKLIIKTNPIKVTLKNFVKKVQ